MEKDAAAVAKKCMALVTQIQGEVNKGVDEVWVWVSEKLSGGLGVPSLRQVVFGALCTPFLSRLGGWHIHEMHSKALSSTRLGVPSLRRVVFGALCTPLLPRLGDTSMRCTLRHPLLHPHRHPNARVGVVWIS